MPNYAITDYCSAPQNTAANAAALLETYLETIDNTKTIYSIGIIAQGNQFVAYCIHLA
jgi:hypothetical protein